MGLATSGQWKDCGGNGCQIRIEDNHEGDGRHIHWECRDGTSGTCGENDTGSHGGTNCSGMTRRLKKCARKFGFNPDPVPDPQRNMCDECVGAAIWTFVVGVGWVLLNGCGALLGITS